MTDARGLIMALRDSMYRAADGFGELLDQIDEKDKEIARLKTINKAMCKLLDEQAEPVKYAEKEVN